jgi:peptidoglycan/xylan/chitin deacetylase (PgdA/CDA1 family)
VKRLLVKALRVSGVLRLARFSNRRRLLLLTYHGVLPAGSGADDYLARNCVDADAFARQMRFLSRHYRCISLSDAVAGLAGEKPLPHRAAVVTFDDGFRNNLDHALPVLRQYGVPATVFVTTDHIGRGTRLLWTERVARLVTESRPGDRIDVVVAGERITASSPGERREAARALLKRLKSVPVGERDRAIAELEQALGADAGAPEEDRYAFLDWDGVRALIAGGVEIGSHTATHAVLTSLTPDAIRRELARSKGAIERHIGRPCVLFSYPNGTAADFNDAAKAALREAGFVCALSQIPGMNTAGTDRYELRRVNIGRGHDDLLFEAQVAGVWTWFAAAASWLRAGVEKLRPAGVGAEAIG